MKVEKDISMTSDLLRTVERLRIGANEHNPDQNECIDGILSQQRPRQRTRRDTQALKELEKDFLTPQTSFDAKWLHKLQQYGVQLRGVRTC